MKSKKGFSINAMLPIALTFVVVAVAIAIGASVLTEIRGSSAFTTNDYGYNVTTHGLESLSTFGDWLPTLALVVVAAIIIGVLIVYLAGRMQG